MVSIASDFPKLEPIELDNIVFICFYKGKKGTYTETHRCNILKLK
jgi:hypothetical protein